MITTKIARSERDLSIWEDRTFFCVAGGGVQNDQIDFSVAQEFGKTGPSNRGVFINPTWTLFGSS